MQASVLSNEKYPQSGQVSPRLPLVEIRLRLGFRDSTEGDWAEASSTTNRLQESRDLALEHRHAEIVPPLTSTHLPPGRTPA
jgi:hypothetical protein